MATASVMSANNSTDDSDEQQQHCRHCQSPALLLDWAAGDLVCTNCGVVNEEHVCDDRPEWREFSEDADNGTNLNKARCGVTVVDDSKYLGGLEPTRLSKQAFGGGVCPIRKTLHKINRQADAMMVRHNAQALKQAKLSRRVRQKLLMQSSKSGDVTETDTTDLEDASDYAAVRPEHDLQVIQEEEDAIRSQEALSADKWSLQRAILLFGSPHEQSIEENVEEEREELEKALDKTMLKASSDLYQCYALLQQSCRKLHLPDRVSHEGTHMLCKYASRCNGLFVKGVSSRVSKQKQNNGNNVATKQQQEQQDKLREYNKVKQFASLGSALLFLTARNLGWTRSLQEVCDAFSTKNVTNATAGHNFVMLIKPKHSFRAIRQIKATFPDYAGSVMVTSHNGANNGGTTEDDTDRFVEHATRKLNLPPVALASVKMLVARLCQNGSRKSSSSSTLSIVCASTTYFVCSAGDTMQQLAQQAQAKQQLNTASHNKQRRGLKRKSDVLSNKVAAAVMPGKKLFKEDLEAKPLVNKSVEKQEDQTKVTTTGKPKTEAPEIQKEDAKPFDVFSHAPIPQDEQQKAEYEARRIWDAWTEQMPWSRSVGVIEQSCGVSRHKITEYYKTGLHPKRTDWLQHLTNASANMKDTPLASSLLSNISAAAPLMSAKWKD